MQRPTIQNSDKVVIDLQALALNLIVRQEVGYSQGVLSAESLVQRWKRNVMLTSSTVPMVPSSVLVLKIIHTRQDRGQIANPFSRLVATPIAGRVHGFTSRCLRNRSLQHLRRSPQGQALRSQRSDQWLQPVVQRKQACPHAQRLHRRHFVDSIGKAVQTCYSGF